MNRLLMQKTSLIPPVIRNFEDFKRVSDVIVANRWDKSLEGCEG